MNNMLRYIVYILLFLLFTITVGQDYHTVETTDLPPQTSCYQQQQDPCKRTVDFLFTNNFADMPQIAISLDNPSTSKFKCIVRILTALSELKKQELQTNHIVCHTFHSLYTDALVVVILTAIALVAVALGIARAISPRSYNSQKGEAYECGIPTRGRSWMQFKVGYYLFAILFLMFDVETVFLFPWAVVVQDLGVYGLFSILFFLVILVLGLAYAWKKGALEWK